MYGSNARQNHLGASCTDGRDFEIHVARAVTSKDCTNILSTQP